MARDEKGRFIAGTGGGGSGGGGASGGDAAKGAQQATASFTKMQGAAGKLAGGIKSLGGAAKSLATGPLPSASSAMSSLGSMAGGAATSGADMLAGALSALGPEGAAAGAALQAAAAVFAATAGTLATLAGIAIDVTQKIDLMRDRFAALAGSAAGGKEVQASIAKLASTLPFASSQVSEWGQGLLAAGVKGKQLEDDIKAIAAATALMGESGGAAANTLFKRLGEGGPAADKLLKTFKTGGPKADKLLKEMGLSIADLGGQAALAKMSSEQLHQALAKAMAKKGKGSLEDMALTFPSILQKAREGFLSLFAKLGPAVKPFMKAVKELFGNFNKGTPLVKSLQGVVTKVFTAIFGWATKAVKVVSEVMKALSGKGKPGALTSIVGALKAIFTNAYVLKGIKAIFMFIAVSAGVAAAAFGVVVVVVSAVAAAVVGAVGWIVDAVSSLASSISDGVSSAVSALSGLASGAMSAAGNFISGLVDGISAGAGAVIAAVKGIASGAISAFTGALGIKSPSTVMAKMGGFAAEGAAQGIDVKADKVQDSAASMGEGVKAGAAKGMGGAGGGKGGGGRSITIESGAIVIHAGGATITEEALAMVLERLLASQGA